MSIGQNVAFSVAVSQFPSNSSMLYIQWRRNGANIPGTQTTFSNVAGTVFATLTITNAQPTNAGSYSAAASDSDGAVGTTNVNLFLTNLTALVVGDVFANRGTIYLSSGGTGTADNFSSTNEFGTPSNNNIPGGSMVWLEGYNASPSSGIVTVDTRGSDFDTTLGIYTNVNIFSPAVTNLGAVIADDDAGGFFNSAASFNMPAYSGPYEIGMDGYYAGRGHIVLNWSFQATTNLLPVIIQQPVSQTTTSNSTAFLSVSVATNNLNTSPLHYQWFFNGTPINGQTQSSLTIPNVLPSTVGQYRVRVQYSNETTNYAVMSQKVQIQINTAGNTTAAAQFKLHQAADPNSYPGGIVPLITPVSGFTGTQIYCAFESLREDGEPYPCGKNVGEPAWYSCLPTNNGTLTVDAYTPNDTNAVGVYTWPGGNSYASLVSVACQSTNPGVGHEVTSLYATNGITYYIIVNGLSGGVGASYLSLTFVAPPTIITNPLSQTVPLGNAATLTVSAIGTPSPAYQWRTNKVGGGQNTTTLSFPNFQAVNQGNYDVVVTNLAGSVTSSVATLYLDSPLRLTNTTLTTTNSFNFLLLGKAGTNYIIQATTNLATTNWIPIYTNLATYGLTFYADSNRGGYSNRFFRAMVKTN